MIWTIIIEILFSAVVILGVLYLNRSTKIQQNRKVNILVIVGILLSISLIISAFKQKRYITFSLLNSYLNEVEVRFTEIPQYIELKFKSLEMMNSDNNQFYKSNYPYFGQIPNQYEYKTIYVSEKYQGASIFLFELAKSMHRKSVPAFYVKFSYFLDDVYQIAEQLGVPSLQIVESIVQNWNIKGLTPFIIIDGLEYVAHSTQFMETLAKVLHNCKVHFVGNIQNKKALELIFKYLSYKEILVKQWIPPTKEYLQSIKPNLYFKKLPRDFKTVASLIDQSQEEIILKRNSLIKQIAAYFDAKQLFKEISNYKNSIRVSTLIKDLGVQKLNKLLKFRIINVHNGIASLSTSSFLVD